jgi:hypothetical protein
MVSRRVYFRGAAGARGEPGVWAVTQWHDKSSKKKMVKLFLISKCGCRVVNSKGKEGIGATAEPDGFYTNILEGGNGPNKLTSE